MFVPRGGGYDQGGAGQALEHHERFGPALLADGPRDRRVVQADDLDLAAHRTILP
jgi:hypothetical protein